MERLRVQPVGPERLADCLAIRREVFVRGQGVPEALEIDGEDGACAHFLALAGERPVGTARLHPLEGAVKVERVAVLEPWRGQGVGRALMAALEAAAAARGFAEIVLHAQQAVVPFYEKLGYLCEGEPFVEAAIPHRRMRRRLARA